MRPFRYLRDPLFVTGCAAYAVNRWLVKPRVEAEFFHFYFNDLWLIPCALPPILLLHRLLGLRQHDRHPTLMEVFLHLMVWCLVCEGIGPHWMKSSSGDLRDMVAYATGALGAAVIWKWRKHRPPVAPHEL